MRRIPSFYEKLGFAIISILFASFLVWIYEGFFTSSDKTVEKPRGVAADKIDSTFIKSLEVSLLLQYYTERLKLSRDFFVKDIHGMSILLYKLIGSKPKVVFYYSELNCQVCVDREIGNIKSFSHEVGKENVLIISSYRHHKTLSMFKRVHALDLEVYNRENLTLGLPAEKANRPCLFLVDSSLVINNQICIHSGQGDWQSFECILLLCQRDHREPQKLNDN